MELPLRPPIRPMLATAADAVPDRPGLRFEPKWDGYRCLVFRDGDKVVLQSRSGKSLTSAFPDVVDALRSALPRRIVIDGELVVAVNGRLDFDALAERANPPHRGAQELRRRLPASYVAFDLLAIEDVAVLGLGFDQRRAALQEVLDPVPGRVALTPCTDDAEVAKRWFAVFEGAGLDGVVAKSGTGPYHPGRRSMIKIKHARTADCVVAGFRMHAGDRAAVGSLLLGLYDDAGVLHHVGVVGAFDNARRRALLDQVAPLRLAPGAQHPWLAPPDDRRLPGSDTRWRTGADWTPLRPDLVAEVRYEHTEGAWPPRFRHNAQWGRWRPDRDPTSCRYDQLDEPARYDLDAVLRGEVLDARRTDAPYGSLTPDTPGSV